MKIKFFFVMKYIHSCCFSASFLLACALVGLLSAGCSKESLQENGSVIRLGSSAMDVTRAVDSATDLARIGADVGIYGVPVGASVTVPADDSQWGNAAIMDNVRTTAIDALSGAVSWSGTYYYPAQTDHYVEFCAYHPFAELAAAGSDARFCMEAPVSGKAPRLHFTLSGEEDVMFAGPVVGSRSHKPQDLVFRHALTQLRFRLIDRYGALSDVTLRSISFPRVNTRSSMNIQSGALGEWSFPGALSLPGVGEVLISGTEAAPQTVGREIMLQPGLSEFEIEVVTSRGTYTGVVRPTSSVGGVPETTFAAGRSYLVTLTFQQRTDISLSASVVPWALGGTDSAVIQ